MLDHAKRSFTVYQGSGNLHLYPASLCKSSLSCSVCFYSTLELLHAVGRAEVVLKRTVAIHGNVEVELGGEGKQRACVVGVLDSADAHTQEPVDIQHLLLQHTHFIKDALHTAFITFIQI